MPKTTQKGCSSPLALFHFPPTVTLTILTDKKASLRKTNSNRLNCTLGSVYVFGYHFLSSLGIIFKKLKDCQFFQSAIQSANFAL